MELARRPAPRLVVVPATVPVIFDSRVRCGTPPSYSITSVGIQSRNRSRLLPIRRTAAC
jgi:hypothetical protein